jgi:hypothetical protein
VFPIFPRSSGIYRLTMSDGPDQGLPLVYVGESDDLRRRNYHYRRPGPSQQTSQRLHDDLRAHLGAGGLITLAISTAATIEAGCESSPLPLGRKTARVLAEHTIRVRCSPHLVRTREGEAESAGADLRQRL